MRGEREVKGIITAEQLFGGLKESGLHPQIASGLYTHEKAHANADPERRGEFGFIVTPGWVVAYYLIHGERTPEQLMEIASAPGKSQMSDQDWRVYTAAWKDKLIELRENGYQEQERAGQENMKENKDDKPFSLDNIKDELAGRLSGKLDDLGGKGEFPNLQEILDYEFSDLFKKHGAAIRKALEEVRREFEDEIYRQEGRAA